MEKNSLIMQYFEWYLPNDGQHWKRLADDAEHLSQIGVNNVWFPPVFKATSTDDVGYGIYDLWDLGEFEQKGDIRTKYGNKEELLHAIKALKEKGIRPIADIVLNHKANADGKEKFKVLKMDPNNRQQSVSEPYDIEAWTYFNFPGRQQTYNDFEWHWYHFSGIDYDAGNDEMGIYMILGDNKGWADNEVVDSEFGNYDYLMFADVDFNHPEVVEHLKEWSSWFVKETGFEGFRLDAIKHIDLTFISEFIETLINEFGPDFFVFGEYWNPDFTANMEYLASIDYEFDLFDVSLHMNLYEASKSGNSYDMRTIFDNTLVKDNPMVAVTFVNNHDTQSGQSLQSPVENWFIQHAYALILLRMGGIPTLFYGDYYGEGYGDHQDAFQEQLDPLLQLRLRYAYGDQVDYFDHGNTIGWTRLGTDEHPDGSAVVMTNGEEGFKSMSMGSLNAHKKFVDFLGNHDAVIELDENGNANFPVRAGSVSVWVSQESI
ncbi:alpha-amylase [Facklamia sp. DSM 111018]|uniref:Alpha-amylase n=1 Tax=Facklamia lactis TaxID=2749967 RepID=A0ABS0LSQ6_9LACT|nr:alpha-amylase [Facklamia lactis]MBG9981323.1 alpha-amylase [Facklamia lactis]MBG9987201.1 alpha-amylase [Facklamia lactis]